MLRIIFAFVKIYPYLAVLLEVTLVAGDDENNVLTDDLAEFLDPVADLGERVAVRDVVHKQRTVGVAVVERRQRMEALLTRGVPDHQAHGLLADVKTLVQKRRLRGVIKSEL